MTRSQDRSSVLGLFYDIISAPNHCFRLECAGHFTPRNKELNLPRIKNKILEYGVKQTTINKIQFLLVPNSVPELVPNSVPELFPNSVPDSFEFCPCWFRIHFLPDPHLDFFLRVGSGHLFSV